MNCIQSGSTVHGIFQARILEWTAIPFSRGFSQPRDWTQVFCFEEVTTWGTREPQCSPEKGNYMWSSIINYKSLTIYKQCFMLEIMIKLIGKIFKWGTSSAAAAAAAAAKSLQSCPTLCDPIDGSPPGSPIPGILQTRRLEWVAISFSNA